MNTVRLILGDSLIKLKDLESGSIDAVISDPPYELGFMGKGWDATGIAYSPELWGECFRILKPNGIIKAFSGTRTYHRMAQALKKSGFVDFEVHAWTYGSGFPKSMDVSKQLDKQAAPEAAKQWSGYGTALKPAWEPIVVARKPA